MPQLYELVGELEHSPAYYKDLCKHYAEEAEQSATNAGISETNAENSATSASGSASTATDQANIATTQAGLASASANTASGYATTAGQKANEASASAQTATDQAGIATTQAGIATNKASEASGYATTASTQAGIATTQAGIATNKANEASGYATTASTQAGIATTQAGLASGSATSASASANIAEQWATKMDGTVDDSEYSAKYYANEASNSASSASASADSAQTNADYIQDEATKIDTTEKRVSNIEKLLQGNLYDYQTDTDTKYTKTVPAGAMPYASLDSIGGKTLVWNQLVQNGNFADASGWSIEYGSASVSNNVLTYTVVTPLSNAFVEGNVLGTVTGHKYLVTCEIRYNNTLPNQQIAIGSGGYDMFLESITQLNTWVGVAGFFTRMSGGTDKIRVYIRTGTATAGDTIDIKNVMCVDLTLMFGAGNEPTTVDEFTAQFPAQYYPYNAGTLLSAGVTSVVSQGKNLAYFGGEQGYPSNTASSNTAKRTFTDGKYVVGMTGNNYYGASVVTNVSINGGTVSFQASQTGYGISVPFDVIVGEKITVSATLSNTALHLAFYSEDGTYLSNSTTTTTTVPANARRCLFVVVPSVANTIVSASNIQVERGSSVTPYSPYKAPIQYPIPAEIQALEGYGWSAGTVFNYIDYERKMFVKNVGKAVLDGTVSPTLVDWRADANSVGCGYATASFNVKQVDASVVPNIIADKLMTVSYTELITSPYPSKAIGRHNTNNYSFLLRLPDPSLTTVALVNAYLSANPITVYYELATPQETDISEYITDDNLINVEAGGTITFPNSNGTDYQIPVPSAETYMVDLQASL